MLTLFVVRLAGAVAREEGERRRQGGQSAADGRISARWQDLTLRNADLEPILGLRRTPPTN